MLLTFDIDIKVVVYKQGLPHLIWRAFAVVCLYTTNLNCTREQTNKLFYTDAYTNFATPHIHLGEGKRLELPYLSASVPIEVCLLYTTDTNFYEGEEAWTPDPRFGMKYLYSTPLTRILHLLWGNRRIKSCLDRCSPNWATPSIINTQENKRRNFVYGREGHSGFIYSEVSLFFTTCVLNFLKPGPLRGRVAYLPESPGLPILYRKSRWSISPPTFRWFIDLATLNLSNTFQIHSTRFLFGCQQLFIVTS